MTPETDDWWQCIVFDPDFATGPSVLAFIEKVSTIAIWNRVLVFAQRWLVECFDNAADNDFQVATIAELRAVLPSVVQIDWSDFLFVADMQAVAAVIRDSSARTRMAHAEFTVRVVDNSYFYVYSRSARYAIAIASMFPSCRIDKTTLELLDMSQHTRRREWRNAQGLGRHGIEV